MAACLVAGSTCAAALADQHEASNPKTAPQPTNSARTGKTASAAHQAGDPFGKQERALAEKATYAARMLALKRAGRGQGHSAMLQGGAVQGILPGSPGTLALGGSDSCSTPDVIVGTGTFAFDNSLATMGVEGQSESICHNAYGLTSIDQDVWYVWTAPSSGMATFSLCGGTTIDSIIAVYAGSACPVAGTALACSDDACSAYVLQSQVSFHCTGGSAYMLQLGSLALSPGGSGTFTLNVGAGGGGQANDSCSTPAAISGSGTFAFDTSAATTGIQGQSESLCVSYTYTAIQNDIWFAWTAPSTGSAAFSLCGGTTLDTKIAVYAGSSCPAPGTALACNDDFCGSPPRQSNATFPCTGGATYLLQLGSFPFNPGGSGTFTLNVGGGSANDECSSATAISGSGPFAFNTTSATTSTQQTFCGTAYNDLWYEWVAPSNGICTLSLCGSTFDTLIAVYAGSGCAATGSWLACNDNFCGYQSQLDFPCAAGSHYMLQVGGGGGNFGAGAFTLHLGLAAANDDCSAATVIAGVGAFAFDNTLATTGAEGQSESLCNLLFSTTVYRDVWYAWTAPSTGTATLALCGGASMDSKVAAYPGSSCPAPGTALACNDDYFACPTLESSIFFPVTSGGNYMLQIGNSLGSPGASGAFTLTVGYVGPPANDDCSTPEVISGVGAFNFDTLNATTGPQQGLSCFQGEARQDVWYDWIAPMTGVAQWSFCSGAPFDTLIAVYPGSGCPSPGTALICDDDGCGLYGAHIYTSQCMFDVVAGSHYLLQLGAALPGPTYAGSGSFSLEVAPHPGPCSAWDDGTGDSLVGWLAGGDMVWMNRFGEPGVSTTISAVEVAWGSTIWPGLNPGNGTPTDIFIWQDGPQFGNPNYATLLLRIPTTVSLVDTDTYVTFPIAPLTLTGYFFAGSHQDHHGSAGGGPGQFVAPFDASVHVFTNVSWFFGNYSGFGTSPVDYANPNNNLQWPVSFDSQGYPGQALVRVSCLGAPATYTCDPGSSGTLACPCANPPAGSARGCDNVSATGGASIAGAGLNLLSNPTLVFTTAGENPTVASILLQGTALSAGANFGHGIRCAGGSIKRLYAKVAVSGSVTMPVLPTDPNIPSRSAFLGDTIAAGTKRWYQVYYRDNTLVLPGCPLPSNRFDATNAAEVTWLP